ncbi:hypothetical protein DBR43_03845 [Pedobacter sp. KBW06]|uniref:hypothetical protein n=1 Tax=Pedobacter sp. KBW06 TaxID=2153359 RepID=UPI000F5B631F|nr:hypothetical protein [Pedobacter sp. KBW06]RQO74533.1 hypothetical protein DBR43_03845 [Pedobacter sp. KBW06]
MEKFDKIIEVLNVKQKVDESECMVLWKTFLQGRSSYLVFLDNSKTIRDSIRKLNSTPLRQLQIDQRWREQRRIVKDLQNVISSGQNFLDHLKYSHNFSEEVYDKTYTIFFRELRNYLVHNDTFKLVTKNEYNIDQEPKFYQAMDKSLFTSFIIKKAKEKYDCIKLNTTEDNKRDGKQFCEWMSLLKFLDEKEPMFDFEPILNHYIISLNAYYSNWVLSILKKKVKLFLLKKFSEDMKIVNNHFFSQFSESRLRYLRLAIFKKEKLIPRRK